jgi:ribosomal protein S27AE
MQTWKEILCPHCKARSVLNDYSERQKCQSCGKTFVPVEQNLPPFMD